jgi:poly[(R)-3-hydroxyalkanoate] polymerase subunit PhaC
VMMDDREIKLADLTVPLLAFAGAGDGIAPVQCVRPIVDLVPGVDDLRFEIVPGGHLGMLTGRAARSTTWRILDEWIVQHSSPDAAAPTPAATKATGATGATAKKRPASKAAARRTPAKKATKSAIGANPNRRYGSAGSRSLAKKK